MSVSIRFNNSELEAVKDYAKAYDMTVSECIRKAVLERIEDEYDLNVYKKAKTEFDKDSTVYSHEEIGKLLDLE